MEFQSYKGIIALDIDGTITAESHSIDLQVVEYLYSLYQEKWMLVFITGRPFSWGWSVLRHLPFSYFYAVQNGATLLSMPSGTVLKQKLLDKDILPKMDLICEDEHTDFIIYSGYEHGDICYYRPERFSDELNQYLQRRSGSLKEKWQPVESFDHLSLNHFASLKCFAKDDQAHRLANRIESAIGLHVPLNRDPFDFNYYVIQATHPEATKGGVLSYMKQLTGIASPVIAAGDDGNDLTMLQEANYKIVMQTAPEEIRKIADLIALPATENGIIEGLKQGIIEVLRRY